MQARHADVVVTRDLRAHHPGRDRGLFGHRQIGGAGGDDGDAPAGGERVGVEPGAAPVLVVLDRGECLPEGVKLGGVDAGHEQAPGLGEDALADRGDLGRRLADREHDLRQAIAEGAVVVERGEAELFRGVDAQPFGRLRRADVASSHGLQERVEGGRIHGASVAQGRSTARSSCRTLGRCCSALASAYLVSR